MLRLLLIFLIIGAAVLQARAVLPAGHFQQRLLELQGHGSCAALPQFGVGTHQGRNPDDVNLKLISEIQAKMVRIDLPWINLEQQGQYDFGPFDGLINGLRRGGKSIVLVLAYGHPDHSDGLAPNGFPLPPHTSEQRTAYGKYAKAVAQRYHGPDIAYEIWNEPNLDLFWPPSFDIKAYGKLLTEAAHAIREVEPNATILPAGLANENDPPKLLYSLTTSGALNMVDGINFHPYRFEGPENSLYDIAKFENAATKRADLPLWITEWGYSELWPGQGTQNTRDRQATMIARLMLTAALSKAKAALVYDLIDDGQDANAEAHFGLYDYDFRPKPAAHTFRSFSGLMSDCDAYEFSVDSKQGVITARFTGKLGTTYVVWGYRSQNENDYCFDPGQMQQPNLMDIFDNHVQLRRCASHSGFALPISDSTGPLILSTKALN
jgi:hypothetical protein